MKIGWYWIVFFLLMWSLTANGQLVDLAVIVTGSNSQQPLQYASVELYKTKFATHTDKEGKAEILKIQPGRYELIVRYVGYLAYRRTLMISQDTSLSITLTEFVTNLDEVTVSSQSISPSQQLSISSITLNQRELRNVPSIGGEHDISRTLATTPGIKLDNEGNAGLYVRGGSADQNLYLIQQAPLYKYSHFFGFLSPLNSDVVQQIDFYKGGFPARFGGRVSSVLDATIRPASMHQLKVQGSIGILSSRLLIEIPIVKDRVSLLIACRRSYFDIFTSFFQGSGTTSGPTYTFYDLNANLTARLGNRTRLEVFTYQAQDRLRAGAINALENLQYDQRWVNTVAGINVTTQFSPQFSNKAEINVSNYRLNQLTDQQQQSITTKYFFANKLNTQTLRNTVEWTPTSAYTLRLGGVYARYALQPVNLTFEGQGDYMNASLDSSHITEGSGFLENEFRIKHISGNAGIRLTAYQVANQHYTFPEPRMLLQYSLTASSAIKASYARMNQVLHLVMNPGFGIPVDLWFPAKGVIRPQSSDQVSIAYNRDVQLKSNQLLTVAIEGYYKAMDHIVAYRDGYSSQDFTTLSQNNNRRWDEIITTGQGNSYGAELLVQKKQGRFTGWIGYTLSWTTNQFDQLNNGKPFYAQQDRRHDVSIVGTYQLNKRWTLNGTWVYQTGQPVTLPQAVYSNPTFDFLTNRFSGYSPNLFIYGERNSYRMKATHRLDISIQRKTTHKWGVGEFAVSIYNLYNRKNPYYYYLSIGNQVKSVSLFQLIPSLSYSFNIYTGKK